VDDIEWFIKVFSTWPCKSVCRQRSHH